ncbi:MAG: hypothetical protein LH461_01400, partial [Spirochaetaceae bacterium]|nr:hypothetical protein [Spirochaetaceae bacterium]
MVTSRTLAFWLMKDQVVRFMAATALRTSGHSRRTVIRSTPAAVDGSVGPDVTGGAEGAAGTGAAGSSCVGVEAWCGAVGAVAGGADGTAGVAGVAAAAPAKATG